MNNLRIYMEQPRLIREPMTWIQHLRSISADAIQNYIIYIMKYTDEEYETYIFGEYDDDVDYVLQEFVNHLYVKIFVSDDNYVDTTEFDYKLEMLFNWHNVFTTGLHRDEDIDIYFNSEYEYFDCILDNMFSKSLK